MLWLLTSVSIVVVFVLLLTLSKRISELQHEVRGMTGRLDKLEQLRTPMKQVAVAAPPSVEHERPQNSIPRTSAPAMSSSSPTSTSTSPSTVTTSTLTSRTDESLETRIGSRWLLYAGVVAIVVGVAYFEKLALDNHWINETARVVQGGVVGLLLVYAGLRFVRAGYRMYGQMLSGCGVALMYLSTYAAFNFYDLVSRPVAFVTMSIITAFAAYVADRQRSQGLALVAVIGGFATPFLLPGHTDAEVALFGYETVLISGSALLARRQEWLALYLVSYALTALTVLGWATRFYEPDKYLTTELFLTVFCSMYLYILFALRRSSHPFAQIARNVLWTTPVVYYMASLAVLTVHSVALLVYLVLFGLAGALAGTRMASPALRSNVRLLLLLACEVPLLLWTQDHAGRSWLYPGLITAAALYTINLLVYGEHVTASDEDKTTPQPPEVALVQLNGLGTFGCVYVLVSPFSLGMAALIAAAFAAWNGALALRVGAHHRDRGLYFAALGFTLLTIAIGIEFNGAWLTAGWAAEGAVVTFIGLRERRDWLRWSGALLFVVATARLFSLLFSPSSVGERVVLNLRFGCAMFVVALASVLARIHQRYRSSPEASLPVASLIVLANVVTLAAITSEISSYWSIRGLDRFTTEGLRINADFAREMMTSIVWASYATIAIVFGIRRQYAPVRYFAIAAFGLTILKVLIVDLEELDRVYRVSSILGLGVALLTASYLYHRFAAGPRERVEERTSPTA